jgi:phytanoyl-CoA hydroxylase
MRLHPLNRSFTWVEGTTEPRLLTVDQVANFDRDGYVLVRDALAAGDIEQLTAAIDPWEARTEAFLRRQPGGTMSIATADEITFTVHLVERCAEARRFAADPVMAGLCHDLVGNDVRLYWDQAVYK